MPRSPTSKRPTGAWRLARQAAVPLLLLVACLLAYAEEDAERAFRVGSPSVVCLRNAELVASGLIVDEKGLILTHVNVAASPLALTAELDSVEDGQPRAVTFRRVELAGVHPTYDLALLRIDPSEAKAHLKAARLSRKRASRGQSVFVIGNPSAGENVLTKTLTPGLVSAEDRRFDGLSFCQLNAALNPGDIGGPCCDKEGAVVGILTFVPGEAESTAFAIPVAAIQLREFVPPKERPRNERLSRLLLEEANRFFTLAGQLEERYGADDKRFEECSLISLILFRGALVMAPGDAGLLHKVGTAWRILGRNEVAIAYLALAVRGKPWFDPSGLAYRELSFALDNLARHDEALLVLREGLAKYPRRGGAMWEDMAIRWAADDAPVKDYVQAGEAARMALTVGDCREPFLRDLLDRIRAAMSEEQKAELDDRIAVIPERLARMEAASQEARRAGTVHVHPEFGELLAKLLGDPPPEAPKAAPPAEDASGRWIRGKISLAENFIKIQRSDKAAEALEEVLRTYPDHAEAAKARQLLEQCRAKK